MRIIFILIGALTLAISSRAEDRHFAATNLWRAETGRFSQSSPARATNGVIYTISLDGWLTAINPDGTRRWAFSIGFESVSSPAVGTDGSIFFGSRNHRIYAVSAAGQKKWDFKTSGWVDAAPALGVDGAVYVGSWDKKFYALNADGSKRWEFLTGGPIVSSAAIATNGVIYFGSHDRKFYALNADGSKRWEFLTGGPITSSPAIGSAGEVYFTSVDGKCYAVNADGTRRWVLQTGGITSSSPVLGVDGTIFLSVNQTHIAITPEGKLKWQRAFWHPEPGYFGETAALVLADESVVFTGGDGFVMTVPTADGDKDWLWNYYLLGPSYSAPLAAADGTVYVLGVGGQLQALRRSVPAASTAWPMFRGNPQRTGRAASGN